MDGIRVCIYRGTGVGSGSQINTLQERLERQGADVDVHQPKAGQPGLPARLSGHYDLVIFPEGTASIMQKRLAEDDSIERLKTFVKEGGAYIGFSAGAFLASQPREEGGVGVGLIEARYTLVGQQNSSSHKAHKPVAVRAIVELDAAGALVEAGYDVLICGFNNGALWDLKDLGPGVEVLAHVSSVHNVGRSKSMDAGTGHIVPASPPQTSPLSVAEDGSLKTMMGKAAIIAGSFGSGRLVLAGPQVEQNEDLEDLLAMFIDLCTSPSSSLSISSGTTHSPALSSCFSSPQQNESERDAVDIAPLSLNGSSSQGNAPTQVRSQKTNEMPQAPAVLQSELSRDRQSRGGGLKSRQGVAMEKQREDGEAQGPQRAEYRRQQAHVNGSLTAVGQHHSEEGQRQGKDRRGRSAGPVPVIMSEPWPETEHVSSPPVIQRPRMPNRTSPPPTPTSLPSQQQSARTPPEQPQQRQRHTGKQIQDARPSPSIQNPQHSIQRQDQPSRTPRSEGQAVTPLSGPAQASESVRGIPVSNIQNSVPAQQRAFSDMQKNVQEFSMSGIASVAGEAVSGARSHARRSGRRPKLQHSH